MGRHSRLMLHTQTPTNPYTKWSRKDLLKELTELSEAYEKKRIALSEISSSLHSEFLAARVADIWQIAPAVEKLRCTLSNTRCQRTRAENKLKKLRFKLKNYSVREFVTVARKVLL